MGIWLTVAQVAIVGNLLLLSGLCFVWGRNVRAFGSKHSLGLLFFGVVLLAENALAFYFFTIHPITHYWLNSAAAIAQQGMMALQVLEFGALGFLAWVTWD
ncbi:MAG: hypothetical protein ABEJ58_00090 [Halodesulfurarchaeum sp.]